MPQTVFNNKNIYNKEKNQKPRDCPHSAKVTMDPITMAAPVALIAASPPWWICKKNPREGEEQPGGDFLICVEVRALICLISVTADQVWNGA